MGRKSEWTQEQVEELVRLYEVEKLGVAACAMRLGKSYGSVWRMLRKLEKGGVLRVRSCGNGKDLLDEVLDAHAAHIKVLSELWEKRATLNRETQKALAELVEAMNRFANVMSRGFERQAKRVRAGR